MRTLVLLFLPWMMSPQPAPVPAYMVYRAAAPITIDGKLNEPAWFGVPDAGTFHFPWWQSGKKERTVVKLLWDEQNLYVAHIAEDEFIQAVHRDRDGKIPEDDCFEIMIAPNPATPDVYFNLEWNVLGGLLDNFRPNGPTKPRAPVWNAEGVQLAGDYSGTLNDDSDRDRYWIVEVKIPLSNFAQVAARVPPRPGDRWNINLNRHGGKVNVQYSQWSPGDTSKPSFHTPHRFGSLIFSANAAPFWQ